MRVLVFGATGTLGRPVTRRLVADGFTVRAMVRNPQRARRLLPAECELVQGDLRDEASVSRALEGADAIYLNLASPFSARTPFDPDRDGTRTVVRCAERAGVRRIVRLSAVEVVPQLLDQWWVLRRKADADAALMESSLRWTLFRSTWLMESIPYFLFWRLLATPRLSPIALHWLAADDYARMVTHALRDESSVGQVLYPRGPEPVTFSEAAQRFVRAMPRAVLWLELPFWLFRLAGLVSAAPRYLADLIQATERYHREIGLPPGNAEPAAHMRLEDYVAYMIASGDKPSKLSA